MLQGFKKLGVPEGTPNFCIGEVWPNDGLAWGKDSSKRSDDSGNISEILPADGAFFLDNVKIFRYSIYHNLKINGIFC